MATQGRRSSPRLEEKAKKEAEDKEKEKEVKKPLEGLPANGSMKFVRDMIKSESQAFNIRRKHLYRTAGNTRVCSWAIHAYWDVSDFYPGQILRYTQTFPQTDLEAHYNGQLGSIAPTSVAPVGVKVRFAVVLWTTTTSIFVVPLYTLNRGQSFSMMNFMRKLDYVTLTIETVPDPGHTPWAGHPIIMNINPKVLGNLSNACYADLSMAIHIGRSEPLQEDIGSLDGDEYLRFLSLYKIKTNAWLKQAFDKFGSGQTFDDSKIVHPSSIKNPKREYNDFEEWQKKIADKQFKGQFWSNRAKQRASQKKKAHASKK